MKYSSIQRQILLISICCALMCVQVSARRKKNKKEEDPNLAILPGVIASQSADCGPKKKPKYAIGAIDGNLSTYAFTCRSKKSKEPEWFKLELENGESLIKKIEIVPMKKKKKGLKNTVLTIRDEYGDVVTSQPIALGRGKKGSVIIDLGEGIIGSEIMIERSAGVKQRSMKLAEVHVGGFVPELPDYYTVTGIRQCAKGKAVQEKSQCRAAAEAVGGSIKKYNRMRSASWSGIPKGCIIGVTHNDILWNTATKVSYGRNFDDYVSVCTRINDQLGA